MTAASTRAAGPRPSTVEEAASVVAELGRAGQPVRPVGRDSRRGWGGRDVSSPVELHSASLNRIREHNPGDFTAVLEAGVTVAEAQATFATAGQWLAVDVPEPAGTIGGLVATADSGPARHRYGGMRDLIIGITVVLSDGTVASAGGKVIKNVAGYDLGKLFTGSYGTLGFIASVAIRLHPRPTGTVTLSAGTDDPARLGRLAVELTRAPLEALSLDAWWRGDSGGVLVRFGGVSAAAQAQRTRALVDGAADVSLVEDDEALWTEHGARQRSSDATVVKVSGRITDLPDVVAATRAAGGSMISRAGLGLSWLTLPAPAAAGPDAQLAALRQALAPRACLVLDGSTRVAQAWPAEQPGVLAVQGRIKARFDPARIFRPGSYLGGDLMDMLREAAASAWDPHQPPDPELIKDCVHCGFCLPTCPSYSVFEEEMDSPRGRIVLMRVGHEPGERVSAPMRLHFDRCLGCMACVTACPSGVQYDRLIEQVRPQLERNAPRPWRERMFHRAVFGLFTHPGRLRATVPLLAVRARLGLGRRVTRLLPSARLRALATLAPEVKLGAMVSRLPVLTPAAEGVTRHGRVALMQGCLQRVLFGDVNAATVRVLAAEGWQVHAPRQPRCCGALQLHSGVEPAALELARATIAAYEGIGGADQHDPVDAIAVNVAGCGSAMKDYGRLLADDPAWARRAEAFSAKVRDVHELLAEHEPQAIRHPISATVAYHDACHLAHAQGIRQAPRDLLRSIPGLELVEPAEWEICCGSAGIYNLTQPQAAATLGQRKAANLAATGAEVIAAANPGCALQIAAYLPTGSVRVLHPITLLDHAIRGAHL